MMAPAKPPKKQHAAYAAVPVSHLLSDLAAEASSAGAPSINTQLLRAAAAVAVSSVELARRTAAFERLKKLIEEATGFTVVPFGSHKTQLLTEDSDIDITVLTNGRTPVSSSAANAVLSSIATILAPVTAGAPCHIKKARTPILKLTERASRFKVDISVEKRDGIQAAEFILQTLRERPYLRQMAILLKCFLKKRRLGDPSVGGLGSYAQFLLLLSFVRLHPLIQAGAIDPTANLGVLMMDFFQFYGIDFPFNQTQVVVRGGYVPNPTGGIWIEDPIVPGNNVAAGCSMVGFIRDVFSHGYRVMAAAVRQGADSQKSVIELWLGRTK